MELTPQTRRDLEGRIVCCHDGGRRGVVGKAMQAQTHVDGARQVSRYTRMVEHLDGLEIVQLRDGRPQRVND